MNCFLTSSPVRPGENALNPANGFVDRLRACLPPVSTALFVCSDPDGAARTDAFAAAMRAGFEDKGFRFRRFEVLDRRNQAQAASLVRDAELVILAGGHVPTQNRFFAEIGLGTLLRGFDGVLVGISAGSMNSAETVYAHPELPGEATDPAYRRFLPGLGLTQKMILPHYQLLKDETLDGLRVMEDIAYPDSCGRRFYVLVDGSYLYIDGRCETLCGEAYLLTEGVLTQITAADESAAV